MLLVDGKAIHKVVINSSIITQAVSENTGGKNSYKKKSGEVETNSTFPDSDNLAVVVANPDGSAQHRLKLGSGKESIAILSIKGAKTTISTQGIETKVVKGDMNATVTTSKEGTNRITLFKDGEELEILPEGSSFEVDSNMLIKQLNGEIQVEVISPLNNQMQF